MDKLKSLGIPSGPLYGRLKRGEEIVTSTGIVVCKVNITTSTHYSFGQSLTETYYLYVLCTALVLVTVVSQHCTHTSDNK